MSLWGAGFAVSCSSYRQCRSQSFLLVPADQDVELSTSSPAPCLLAQWHASYHVDNRNCKLVQLNVFLYKSCCSHDVSSQQ